MYPLGFVSVPFLIYTNIPMMFYYLTISLSNDYLHPYVIVAASSSIAVLVGFGAIFGPIIASYFMTIFGPSGFFVFLFLVHLSIGLFGIYRMAIRIKPSDIKSQYVPLPRTITPTGMELNPKAEIEDSYLGKDSFFEK